MTIDERLQAANAVLSAIAGKGRRMFFSAQHKTTATLLLDSHGEVIYKDPATGQHFIAQPIAAWTGLSDPHARTIIIALAEFVRTGRRFDANLIGQPYITLPGNHWNYPESDLQAIRDHAFSLGVVKGAA